MVCGASLGHRFDGGGLGEARSGPVFHKPEATPQASVAHLSAVERAERNVGLQIEPWKLLRDD
jgi:hypothetical protein